MEARDTRTRILDAAQELIQRLGANGMSYQHISDAVGIRKASIHHHFPSKEDLLDALVDRYSAYFLGLVDDIIASGGDARTKLRRYADLFEATLREGEHDKACLCAMLGAELATLGPASAAGIRTFFAANEKRLAGILETGRKAGEFRFEGNPHTLAALLVSLLEGAALLVRVEGGARKFQQIVRQALEMLP